MQLLSGTCWTLDYARGPCIVMIRLDGNLVMSCVNAMRYNCLAVSAENHVHREYTGAEAVAHGPGRLNEDGLLSSHRQLLRSTL